MSVDGAAHYNRETGELFKYDANGTEYQWDGDAGRWQVYLGNPSAEDPTGGLDQLIHYVGELENLVRWFALGFTYEDPRTGEIVVNDPIWQARDPYGNELPAAQELERTWNRVIRGT